MHFKKKDMRQLARFAGASVEDLDFEECIFASTTLAEAVRGFPALKRVSADNVGPVMNHR